MRVVRAATNAMDEVDRLLAQAKRDALGWMPVPVYRRIHDTAAAAGGGTFVEIGTSNGAATIALALGGKAGGKAFRILTVDRFQAGKGVPGATVSERAQSVRRRFERFGVVDSIEIVAGTAADLVERHDPRAIGLLLLDTDGRIDLELALLYDRLAPACPIIVDDVDGRTYVRRDRGTAVVDQKHRLLRMLVGIYVRAGLLVDRGATLGQTGWYAKGAAALAPGEIERLALPAYRELTRVSLDSAEFGFRRALVRATARRIPVLARAWRHFFPAPPV